MSAETRKGVKKSGGAEKPQSLMGKKCEALMRKKRPAVLLIRTGKTSPNKRMGIVYRNSKKNKNPSENEAQAEVLLGKESSING